MSYIGTRPTVQQILRGSTTPRVTPTTPVPQTPMTLTAASETALNRTTSKERLRTPPLPRDLPRWGSDGRFRQEGSRDAADAVTFSALPDRASFASQPVKIFTDVSKTAERYPIYEKNEKNEREKRKCIVKQVMQEITQQRPFLGTSDMIEVATSATERFMEAFRDHSVRIPLARSDAITLATIVTDVLSGYLSDADKRASLEPPELASRDTSRKEAVDRIFTEDLLQSFREVQESYRKRIERMLAAYDPVRLKSVDNMLRKADEMGFVGATADLLHSLVLEYGPEPSDGTSADPAVVIADPVLSSDASVAVYASVRGDRTDTPAWSLAKGDHFSKTPLGLDTLASMGVASAEIVSSVELGETQKSWTLCLRLQPAGIRPGAQYTVFLSLFGAGGLKAKDSRTFRLEHASDQ